MNKFCLSKKIFSIVIPLFLLFGIPNSTAQTSGNSVEEIVVVGSYIRRDNFDTVAPLSIIDSTDIEQSGALLLGEMVADATYNYGTTDISNHLNGGTGLIAAFNLRGLGGRATLNLLDGRRTIVTNANTNYPAIGIQRIEVLRDGGSALYGTNAVSGVVNMIPIKNYDGLKIQAGYDWDEEGDSYRNEFAGVGGFSFGNTDVVIAWEYQDRPKSIQWTDRPKYMRAGFGDSGFSNPGNFFVPDRDENGLLTGSSSRRPDPGCGTDGSPPG